MSQSDEIELQPIHRPRRTTGKLYPPGRESKIMPYKSMLDIQRESYANPIKRKKKPGILGRLFGGNYD
jgi:hypothetical protein